MCSIIRLQGALSPHYSFHVCKYGDILLFDEIVPMTAGGWVTYGFYRERDTYESFWEFNSEDRHGRNRLPLASASTPLLIPVAITAAFTNAEAAYADAIASLNTSRYNVEMQLRGDDRWFRRTFCAGLSEHELEIIDRWHHFTVRFPIAKPPHISDAHFNLSDVTLDESYACSSFASVWIEQCENNLEATRASAGAPTPPLWMFDVKMLIDEYVLQCKTTAVAVLIFRRERSHSAYVNYANGGAAWNFWDFRRPGALLPEWSGFEVRQYRTSAHRRTKYMYYYVRLFGPREHYSKAALLDAAKALAPLTVLGAHGGMKPIGVCDRERVGRDNDRRAPLSHGGIAATFSLNAMHIGGVNTFAQWLGLHARILDHVIVFEPFALTDYVLLWLLEHLGLVHAPQLKRLRLIASVMASIRSVKAQREHRRNPERVARFLPVHTNNAIEYS